MYERSTTAKKDKNIETLTLITKWNTGFSHLYIHECEHYLFLSSEKSFPLEPN